MDAVTGCYVVAAISGGLLVALFIMAIAGGFDVDVCLDELDIIPSFGIWFSIKALCGFVFVQTAGFALMVDKGGYPPFLAGLITFPLAIFMFVAIVKMMALLNRLESNGMVGNYEYIGCLARVTIPIAPTKPGQVRIASPRESGGSVWKTAMADCAFEEGAMVQITGFLNDMMVVKSYEA